MPKRKIRHALVHYSVDKGDGVVSYETAFRNQIVDIPADQVERLDELGATVAPDEELERPGKMAALPESATDAEITSWVMSATRSEVEALVRERPVMAARIESAAASVAERFNEQNLHLGGLKEIAEESEAKAQAEADAQALAGLSDEDIAVLAELQGLTDDEILELAAAKEEQDQADLIGDTEDEDYDFDEFVTGKASDITAFIAEHPEHAGAILEAEQRRADAAKEDVRVTIVRAAEAAAGFTAN